MVIRIGAGPTAADHVRPTGPAVIVRPPDPRAVPGWADLIAHTIQGVLMAALLGVGMLPAPAPEGAQVWRFESYSGAVRK